VRISRTLFDRQEAKNAKGRVVEPSRRLDDLARRVIGAAIEVHRQLGPGFLEAVYEEAIAIEFGLRRLEFERQPAIKVAYKGRGVGVGRPDFLVGRLLIVEIKAVVQLLPVHSAQVISYLKANRTALGLLLNFKETQMRRGIKRVVLGHPVSVRDDDACDMDERQEAGDRFVVAGCDPSEVFEAIEESLDQITRLVAMLVIATRRYWIGSGWNDRLCMRGFDLLHQAITVVALVRNHGFGLRRLLS